MPSPRVGLETIAARLREQQERIARACERAGRGVDEVTMVAVSKTHPLAAIEAAYEAGHRDFGENYVKELAQKMKDLAHLDQIRWHFIGNLQSNKARLLAEGVHTVAIQHQRSALQLSKHRPAEASPLGAWLQVNVSEESQKAGCDLHLVPDLVDRLRSLPRVRLCGLMTVPSLTPDERVIRQQFKRLRDLCDEQGLRGCSMGMSADLEHAIACGATVVRIGSAVFGPRPVSR